MRGPLIAASASGSGRALANASKSTPFGVSVADLQYFPFRAMIAGEWMNTSSTSAINTRSCSLTGRGTGEYEYSSLMWYMLMSCSMSGSTFAYIGFQMLRRIRVQPFASRIDRACFSLF